MNILEYSGMFWNVLEYSGIFWNILEYSGIFWNILECSGMFWNILECSGIFPLALYVAATGMNKHFLLYSLENDTGFNRFTIKVRNHFCYNVHSSAFGFDISGRQKGLSNSPKWLAKCVVILTYNNNVV